MKILNNKEAQAALAIGLCVIVKGQNNEWTARAIWQENGEYYSLTDKMYKWKVTPFVKVFLSMEDSEYRIVPKDYCPQDNE